MFTFNLESKTSPDWSKMQEEVKGLNGKRAFTRAGVINEQAAREHADSGLSTGTLATIQEYGTDTIPARSFVKATFRKHEKEYRESLKALPLKVLGRDGILDVLDLVGAKMAQDMKSAVFGGVGIPPPNKPSTIKHKGFDHPLLETTELLEAISHDVRLGNTVITEAISQNSKLYTK